MGFLIEETRITTQEDFGVGTLTPTEKLHVVGNFRLENGTESAGYVLSTDANGLTSFVDPATLAFGWVYDGNTVVSEKSIGTLDNFDLPFIVNGGEVMRIASLTGFVGIGTNNPSVKLEVETVTDMYGICHTDGTIKLCSWVGAFGGFSGSWFGSVTNDGFALTTNDTGRIYITDLGLVGVNINTPTEQLHVVGSILIDDGTQLPGYVFTCDATGKGSWQSAVAGSGWSLNGNTNGIEKYIGTDDTYDFPIYTDGFERMRISSIGQVGINTAVYGSATLAITALPISMGIYVSAISAEAVYGESVSGNGAVFNSTNANGVLVNAFGAGYGGSFTSDSGIGIYVTSVSGGVAMHVDQGAVGIGTPTPTQMLDVLGNINVSDGISLGGFSGTAFNEINFGDLGYIKMNGDARMFGNTTNTYLYGSDLIFLNILGIESGRFDATGNLGLGTVAPSEKLHIIGSVLIDDGTQSPGYVLTCDATGKGTWAPGGGGGGSGWLLVGNAGLTDGVDNYWGTTDDVPLNILHNNNPSGRIDNVEQQTFFGYLAGGAIATTFASTAIGHQALYQSTDSDNSTAIGNKSLSGTTTGYNLTALGHIAGATNVTGIGNLYLGYGADADAGNYSNSAAIGYNAIVGADNAMVFGNANVSMGFGISVPTAKVHLVSLGSTDATYAQITENSSNDVLFSIRDDGEFYSKKGYWIDSDGVGTSAKFLSNVNGNTTNVVLGNNSNLHGLANTIGAITVVGSQSGQTWVGASSMDLTILGYNNYNNVTSGYGLISIGSNNSFNSSGSYNHSIAIGNSVIMTASNQMVVGGASSGVDNVYLGHGVSNPDAKIWVGSIETTQGLLTTGAGVSVRLGRYFAGAVAVDGNYIEIEINGVVYKLATAV